MSHHCLDCCEVFTYLTNKGFSGVPAAVSRFLFFLSTALSKPQDAADMDDT